MMANNPQKQPWTEEERASIRQLIRYGLAVFAAVSIALVAVAIASNVLGIAQITLR